MPYDANTAKLLRTPETYEYTHKEKSYIVTTNYIGESSLVDVIKAALKRDYELLYTESQNGNISTNLD